MKSRRRLYIAYALVSLVAAVAGFSLYDMAENGSSSQSQAVTSAAAFAPPEELLGAKRPEFTLPDLTGETTSITRWDGDVLLLNFWATWCSPCRKEMPDLARLQVRYGKRGFQVIGVAIDQADPVRRFIKEIGVDYPQLVGRENALAVADRYGNHFGALPYSVLIDRVGIIRFIKPGLISEQELEVELVRLL
jgi:peroxiredoxin